GSAADACPPCTRRRGAAVSTLDVWAQEALGRHEADAPCRCVLMFSGGRDSTLGALRLSDADKEIVLVTVTSSHLVGIDHVRQRLKEISPHLPPRTPWVHVRQPAELRTDTSFYERTCLPCHHAYVVSAVGCAKHLGATDMAFGYTQYQSNWPEQTPI